LLRKIQLKRKGIRVGISRKVKVAAGVALAVVCATSVAAFACDPTGPTSKGVDQRPHWKLIFDTNKDTKNYGVTIDICGTDLNFSGTDHLRDKLFQKYLGDTAQNEYHTLYDERYEGRTTAVIDGNTLHLRLQRENSDHGFFSIQDGAQDFSEDKGLYDDTIRIINDDGSILLLNYAKTQNFQPTSTKWVADCKQVPETSPLKHHDKK